MTLRVQKRFYPVSLPVDKQIHRVRSLAHAVAKKAAAGLG